MKTFTDNAKRQWQIEINCDSVRRVRARIGFDLLEKDAYEKLQDPIQLADVLFALIEPQAVEKKVSDADFGRALGGDSIEAASAALLEELVDFTPPQRRPALKKALAKLGEMELVAVAAMEQELDRIDVTAEVEKVLKQSGNTSTNSPESAE